MVSNMPQNSFTERDKLLTSQNYSLDIPAAMGYNEAATHPRRSDLA
jgi:hypothetical protein